MAIFSSVGLGRAMLPRLHHPLKSNAASASVLISNLLRTPAVRSFHTPAVGSFHKRGVSSSLSSCSITRPTTSFHAAFILPSLPSRNFSSSSSSSPPSSPPSSASPTTPLDLSSTSSTPLSPVDLDLATSLTAAPSHAYSLSEAWDVASQIAFAASNDHWLPVKAVQFLLDFVHLSSGLPWWASIVATTLLVRSALFPLAIIQYRNGARMTVMRPEMTKISEEFRKRMATEGGVSMAERLQHKERMKNLMAKYQCNPLYSLAMPLVLAPLFLSFFSAIQSMHDLHPSFTQGGYMQFLDLSAPDPYYALPILNAITMLIPLELLPDPNAMPEKDRQRMKKVFRAVAVIFVIVGQSMPSGLFVYWIASNLFTILQQMILRSSRVRRVLSIPDVSQVEPMKGSPFDFLFGKKKEDEAGGVAATVKEAVILRNEEMRGLKTPEQPVQMFHKGGGKKKEDGKQ